LISVGVIILIILGLDEDFVQVGRRPGRPTLTNSGVGLCPLRLLEPPVLTQVALPSTRHSRNYRSYGRDYGS
jgi:hypothetical protein